MVYRPMANNGDTHLTISNFATDGTINVSEGFIIESITGSADIDFAFGRTESQTDGSMRCQFAIEDGALTTFTVSDGVVEGKGFRFLILGANSVSKLRTHTNSKLRIHTSFPFSKLKQTQDTHKFFPLVTTVYTS
ncbi:MAG: hypothetical protein EA401_00895, partial [Planctomycetota bacterium]